MSASDVTGTTRPRATTLPSIVEVDLETSRRGLRSQLARELNGRCVLVRCLDRILQCRRLAPPLLVVRSEQLDEARALVGDAPVRWFAHDEDDLAHRAFLRRARLWGKEGWRGGLSESFFVCEQGTPAALRAACDREDWSAVALVPADAPFLDPVVVDTLVGEFLDGGIERKLYLSSAPPGLGVDVFSRELLEILATHHRSVADVIGFRPDQAAGNPDSHFSHPFAVEISGARGRFTVDSESSARLADSLWREVGQRTSDCRALFEWSAAHPDAVAGAVPEELLFAQAAPEELVALLPREGDLNDEELEWLLSREAAPPRNLVRRAVLEAIAARDDTLLTLDGGFTDALHPGGARFLEEARDTAFGLHLDVPAAWLRCAPLVNRLLGANPDVMGVDLGATDEAALARIAPGSASVAAREAGLATLLERLPSRGTPEAKSGPFVVVTLTLDEASMNHFEPVFDRWHARVDRVVIRGLEGPCGERVAGAAGVFAPPERAACVRLRTQLRILADGRVPLCARDPQVAVRLGDLADGDSIADLWQGQTMRAARRAHAGQRWDEVGHCGACASWFRLD